MKRLRHLLEYAVFRVMLFGVDLLPLKAAGGLGRALAGAWWSVDRRRQRVACDNILRTGVESDPKRARALSKRAAQHFGMVVIESLKSSGLLDDERWRDHLELEIPPDVQAVLDDPKQGLIMASGHLGNWELAAQFLSRYKPVSGITRPMNNPLIEEVITRRKPRYRFRPISKYSKDPSRFLEVLDEGGILALLMDQHPTVGGVPVDFFGHAAPTYTTAAMLHLVTRAPLCFGVCQRLGPGRFRLRTSGLIRVAPSGKKKQDVLEVLQSLNAQLEDAIRETPEQYLWGHRRWRDRDGVPGPQ